MSNKPRKGLNTSPRLTKALEKNGLSVPKLKKDGTPFTPWAEEVALRIKNKEARIAAAGGVDDRTGKCTAMTTGVHGPKRLCDKYAVHGLTVCPTHGGSTQAAKAKAKEFLTNELMPSLKRLTEIRDQDEHMPSALGATAQILNRVMGKADSTERQKGAGAPVIRIGILLGGLPKGQHQLTAQTQVDGENTEPIDAECEDAE